jgi:hypothetical protein
MPVIDYSQGVTDLETLCSGPLAWFRDWPNLAVPAGTAGVYTIWSGDRLVYVGIAVRSLRQRLATHATGRRGGDQFCAYVADRPVLPTVTPDEIKAISVGELSFDARVRCYIHQNFRYPALLPAAYWWNPCSYDASAGLRVEHAAVRPLPYIKLRLTGRTIPVEWPHVKPAARVARKLECRRAPQTAPSTRTILGRQ